MVWVLLTEDLSYIKNIAQLDKKHDISVSIFTSIMSSYIYIPIHQNESLNELYTGMKLVFAQDWIMRISLV